LICCCLESRKYDQSINARIGGLPFVSCQVFCFHLWNDPSRRKYVDMVHFQMSTFSFHARYRASDGIDKTTI
jgi:hypothetical protein